MSVLSDAEKMPFNMFKFYLKLISLDRQNATSFIARKIEHHSPEKVARTEKLLIDLRINVSH